MELSPGLCFIQDTINNVGTRIETGSAQNLTVNNATPFIILRFSWADAQNNYMDMLAVANADIQENDLIVGRCVYDDVGTTLSTTFDYTRRTIFYTNKQKIEDSYLRVTPTEPASNQVTVSSGVLNSSKGNLLVAGGNYPVGGIQNTINGRIDLVYIDENGAVQILLGTDQANPVAPRYGNRKVIAEIRRGASRTSVKGNEIFRVISSYDMNAITGDQLLVDAGNFYSSTNVEDAFQEIAGSPFTFIGDKTFSDSVTINAAANKVAFKVKGSSGQNIAEYRTSANTLTQYIDQNGKLVNTVGADITLADTYSVFTTDKYSEALNQIGGGTMTIAGAKTFSSPITQTSTTGTAPFIISSTTKVNNLNVDQVDNYHVSTSASAGTIPVQGNPVTFTKITGTTSVTAPVITASTSFSSPTITGSTSMTSPVFISTVATGTAPLTVASTTQVTNLNAQMLNGKQSGNGGSQIPVSNGTVNTNLNADMLDGYHIGSGTSQVPLNNGALNSTLNADLVDGCHVSASSSPGYIPVQGNPATFTQLFATTRLRIPNGAPSSPSNGDIWYV